jgi:hypothetical protein
MWHINHSAFSAILLLYINILAYISSGILRAYNKGVIKHNLSTVFVILSVLVPINIIIGV